MTSDAAPEKVDTAISLSGGAGGASSLWSDGEAYTSNRSSRAMAA
jgi:hypothetical protein